MSLLARCRRCLRWSISLSISSLFSCSSSSWLRSRSKSLSCRREGKDIMNCRQGPFSDFLTGNVSAECLWVSHPHQVLHPADDSWSWRLLTSVPTFQPEPMPYLKVMEFDGEKEERGRMEGERERETERERKEREKGVRGIETMQQCSLTHTLRWTIDALLCF